MKEWEMSGMEIRDVKDTKNKFLLKRIEKLTELFDMKINIFYHIFKKEKKRPGLLWPVSSPTTWLGISSLLALPWFLSALWYTPLCYPSFHLSSNPSLFRPQP